MSIFKVGTKIQAILTVSFLIVLSLSSIFALQVTYSDTGVTYDVAGIISNSKGHMWAATGANLQLAIYDIGNNTGSVDVSATNILITSTIIGTEKCNIDFHGATLYATTDINVLQVKPQQTISNLNINVSAVATYTKACIVLNGSDSFKTSYNTSKLSNINLFGGTTQDGTGLLLTAPDAVATYDAIAFCTFNDFFINGFYRGIYLQNLWDSNTGGGAFINGNIFNDITGTRCNYFIFLNNKEGEGASALYSATSGNIFTDIQYQTSTGTDTYFASIEGERNIFSNIVIWDWSGLGDSTAMFRLNYTANETVINYPFGSSSTNRDFIIDDSALGSSGYLTFSSGNYLKMRGSNAPGLNISHINRYEHSSTGLKLFASTKGNPYTYLYGYVSTATKFASLRVDTKGSLEILTQTSGIDLEPASFVVNLSSVLKLTGLTAHPTPAYEGMIYYNDTSNLLMLYTSAWHSIDIT